MPGGSRVRTESANEKGSVRGGKCPIAKGCGDADAFLRVEKERRKKLLKFEAEAESERRALTTLDRSRAPIKLPTVEEMLTLVYQLEARLNADVTKGREELRLLFRDGRIDLLPQPGGFYAARSKLLPLVLLMQPPSEANQGGREPVRYTPSSCAGAQSALYNAVFVLEWDFDISTIEAAA